MGAIVKYRDLPGGPTDVRMGDELSRYCLCTQCGMLSMSAYQDLHGHVFCDNCIQERSYKHHKYDIFCKYEQRNVSLDEMFEANDVVTVIRDQFTFCPNKKCEERVPLEALIDHYCQCTPQVHCAACRKTVPSRDWKAHWQKHLIPGHGEPTPMETNQKQPPMESSSGNQSYKRESQSTPRSDSRQFSGSNREHFAQFPIPPASRNATRSSGLPSEVTRSCRFPAPQLSARNHLATGDATWKSPCDYCGRFVKEVNMAPHLEKCSKAPQTCVYCDKKVLKEDIPAHSRQCDQNPDNSNATTCAAQRTSEPEPHDGNTKAQGSCILEKTIPELPTLALSDEDMKTWHDAFEEHLSMLRINDDHLKYEYLLSALAPDIIQEVGKSETPPTRGREYKWLLELLFELSSSPRKKKNFADIIKKKAQKGKEALLNIFAPAKEGLREHTKNGTVFYCQDTGYEVATSDNGPCSSALADFSHTD